jgi:hypothetical protein
MGRCIAITEARRQRAHIRRLQGGGLPRSWPHPVPSHSALGKEAWSSKSWPRLCWLWERLWINRRLAGICHWQVGQKRRKTLE